MLLGFSGYNPEAVYDLHMTSVENSSYSSCFNLTEKDHCTFDLIKLSSNYVNENRFRFRLDVIDRFGTISKFFAYDHYANVVLCQVTEVKIVELGTRFVYLTWKPPMEIYTRYYLSKSITYQLDIYQIENDQKTIGSTSNKVKYLRSAQLIGATDFKIINLIQSTKYRIDIRCQLTSNSHVNRLGEKVTVDIITKTDAFSINIPNLYPEVFELIKKEDDLLDVVVYLDRVDLTPDLQPKYEKIMIKVSPMLISSKIKIPVNVVPVGQPKKIPDLKPWNLSSISIPDSYYFDDKYAEKSNRSQKITRVKPAMTILPCRPSLTTKSNQIHYLKASEIDFTSCIIENLNTITDYQMQLVAYNSIEPTIGPIISKIPAHSLDKIHPGVDQFYAIDWGHHNYTLEWTVPSIQQVAKYTICLCEVSNLNFQCDGRIETFDLPGNQTSLELTINKDYKLYNLVSG
ncbi:uncharacterized protein LOC128396885 [Panonychus citri]|uniref:uncharacterized protein LOC128396885 n=1 Tax=Panonychus citri TaxID=50023 RepID=UPI002307F1FD|nr:uncharacterized protein LOC128396885 [Panonychus citri]